MEHGNTELRRGGEENLRAEEIQARWDFLLQQGFSEQWITDLKKIRPTLYQIQVVQDHLNDLTERGFSNPKKMIESSPAILGYAFENIDRKLMMLKRIIRLYNLPLAAANLMEQENALIGSKIDKLWVIARICKQYLGSAAELTMPIIHALLFTNLEDLLIALQQQPPLTAVNELLSRAKTLKKQKIPKEQKCQTIMGNNDETLKKIYQRYRRGYPPMKKN